MKKKVIVCLCTALLSCSVMFGCGSKSDANTQTESQTTVQTETQIQTESQTAAQTEGAESTFAEMLADGTYSADFNTDSSMFHVNETCDGKGTLTVKDGKMTIHITLTSKNIVNLYPGLAEDAQKDGAELLQPVTDTVTYKDGTSEEVNGFDVPVPAIDEEFDLALIGTKGVWYDHKVSVSNPVAVEE